MTTHLKEAAARLDRQIAALKTSAEAEALRDELEADIEAIKTARTSTDHGADDFNMIQLLKAYIDEDLSDAYWALKYEERESR